MSAGAINPKRSQQIIYSGGQYVRSDSHHQNAAALGRGFAAIARPKGYGGQCERHEPRPKRSQPSSEREASGFSAEGERGVKRPPFDGKPEAGSANRLKPEFTHNVLLYAVKGFQRRDFV